MHFGERSLSRAYRKHSTLNSKHPESKRGIAAGQEDGARPNGHTDYQEATDRSAEDPDLSGPETPPSESFTAR